MEVVVAPPSGGATKKKSKKPEPRNAPRKAGIQSSNPKTTDKPRTQDPNCRSHCQTNWHCSRACRH